MNNSPQLDTFESALLTELRREVAEHPAPVAAPTFVRRPRRRLRLAAVGAAGIAATVVAVFGLGGSGGSPAYAVEKNADGDVIVTVHRLDDASGLEKALAAKGIDADVSYDADGFGDFTTSNPDGPPPMAPPTGAPGSGAESGTLTQQQDENGPTPTGPGSSAGPDDSCGAADPPATLEQSGDDWVLTIPNGSPLMDRHVEIGTDSSGALAVQYAGNEPNSYCGVVTKNGGAGYGGSTLGD
jgi:hypothetical protein